MRHRIARSASNLTALVHCICDELQPRALQMVVKLPFAFCVRLDQASDGWSWAFVKFRG